MYNRKVCNVYPNNFQKDHEGFKKTLKALENRGLPFDLATYTLILGHVGKYGTMEDVMLRFNEVT